MILSSQQWISDIVVTKRLIKGKTIYFPRNFRAQKKLYQIDSILCGFKPGIHELPKGTIVVDENDEIIQ